MEDGSRWSQVVGLDLGDRSSQVVVVARASGEIMDRRRVRTQQSALRRVFEGAPMEIALEAGTHSPWVSRLLEDLGHRVWVANPRKLRLIYENRRKNDAVDAEYLARLARVDPALLHPLQHRSREAQADLAILRARDVLVRNRTQVVNCVRGMAKALGHRLPACSASSFARRVAEELPDGFAPAGLPMLAILDNLHDQIRVYDRQIERLCLEKYPETQRLRQVQGVGAITALAYRLVLADPHRFRHSRDVGAYLGLVPGQRASGSRDRAQRITKEGDIFLRRLLVQSAHYILGPFGEDCELQRFGHRLTERGGPEAKRRAVVAVARKLAVLLHRLWVSGAVYKPLVSSSEVTMVE